ncbi:MAG: hypothetical protein MHM6MM_000700 [Cercozoa sp. M6MM]
MDMRSSKSSDTLPASRASALRRLYSHDVSVASMFGFDSNTEMDTNSTETQGEPLEKRRRVMREDGVQQVSTPSFLSKAARIRSPWFKHTTTQRHRTTPLSETGTNNTGKLWSTASRRDELADGSNVVSIISWRDRPQIGMAFSDTNDFSATLSVLHSHENIHQIILSETMKESSLARVVKKAAVQRIFRCGRDNDFVPRRHFNSVNGMNRVKRIASVESAKRLSFSEEFFLAFACANAVLAYVDETGLAPELRAASFSVVIRVPSDFLMIHPCAAKELELVKSLTDSQSGSLYSMMSKHCASKAGARFLRSSLLQPLNDADTLNARYDAVSDIVDTGLSGVLYQQLNKLPDIDSVRHMLLYYKKPTDSLSLLRALLRLRDTLQTVRLIGEELSVCGSSVLKAIRSVCMCKEVTEASSDIHKLINEEAVLDKSEVKGDRKRVALIESIRYGQGNRFDFIRGRLKTTIQRIHEEVANVKRAEPSCDMSSVRVHFTSSRGFHLSGSIEILANLSRQKYFILHQTRKTVFFTNKAVRTAENERTQLMQEAVMLAAQLTVKKVNALTEKYGDLLIRISDVVATTDLLNAFARASEMGQTDLNRPTFSDDELVLVDAKHPLLEMYSTTAVQPNSLHLHKDRSLVIITGPNASGKTTILKTVAMIVILAQIGCFVPAGEAKLPRFTQLLTRLYHRDSVDASSFMAECRDVAEITTRADHRSLVIVDELGRATSHLDAVALNWAVSEELIRRQAFCLVATHIQELTQLAEVFVNAAVFHFNVNWSPGEKKRGQFDHKLHEGAHKLSTYGIDLAECMGFPESAIEFAHIVSSIIDEQWKSSMSVSNSTSAHLKAVLHLFRQLAEVPNAGKLSVDRLYQHASSVLQDHLNKEGDEPENRTGGRDTFSDFSDASVAQRSASHDVHFKDHVRQHAGTYSDLSTCDEVQQDNHGVIHPKEGSDLAEIGSDLEVKQTKKAIMTFPVDNVSANNRQRNKQHNKAEANLK